MRILQNLLLAFIGWMVLIFFFGYTYGIEDQQEILPYVKFLKDPSLYAHDFFIQNLSSAIPNERFVFAYLLMPFSNHFEFYLLLFHAISTMLLLYGMHRLASMFIENEIWAWLCVYSSLTILYLYTIGGCDLYYNTFQGSNIAKAIGIWAIYFFLQQKYYLSMILLALITYLQIIVGLDLALLLCAVLLFQKKYKVWMISSLIYGLGAGIYLAMVLYARSGTSSLSANEYFDIMFLFRHPHHFIFSTFPLKNILFVAIMFLVGLYFYFSRNTSLAWFLFIALISTIIYAIAVDVFHSVSIGNFNGYKNIIWVKFFGWVAVFALLEKYVSTWLHRVKIPMTAGYAVLIIFSASLFHGLIMHDYLNLRHQTIHIGKRIQDDALIDISLKAKKDLPKDAVFIVPFHATAFKYWSERSAYVDFKANVRSPQAAGEWYERIKSVYGVSLKDKRTGFDLKHKADVYFAEQYFCSLDRFKRKGVQYFLCAKDHKKIEQYEPPILENGGYKIYQIK